LSTREKAYALQLKVMHDRLSLVMALAEDYELEALLSGDAKAAEFWSSVQSLMLGTDEASEYQRKQWRKVDTFKPALAKVREWIRSGMRAALIREKAA
jgi:hypothetical protein